LVMLKNYECDICDSIYKKQHECIIGKSWYYICQPCMDKHQHKKITHPGDCVRNTTSGYVFDAVMMLPNNRVAFLYSMWYFHPDRFMLNYDGHHNAFVCCYWCRRPKQNDNDSKCHTCHRFSIHHFFNHHMISFYHFVHAPHHLVDDVLHVIYKQLLTLFNLKI